MSDDETISVSVEVSGAGELSDREKSVVSSYEDAIETFILKTRNYGDSFVRSAKIESVLRDGYIDDESIPHLVSKQIFVRGFLDKLSRFYQLEIEGESDNVGEDVDDTLLDMGNYAIMLAAIHRTYDE